MNVLIIGGGGREHALAWRISQSPEVRHIYATPGNPGIASLATCRRPASTAPSAYLQLAEEFSIDFTVVGPEAPLVDGVVDAFRAAGRPILGPTAAAARLEGSKVFSKAFMNQARIPTARFIACDTVSAAHEALRSFTLPVVIKADGLAAGKGVVIAQTSDEARNTLDSLMIGRALGDAGTRVVIEEFLQGEEVSFIALTDGKSIAPLEPTQDHKAVHDNDTGPNTGGMGAYCDSRILTAAERHTILTTIIEPAIAHMNSAGTPFIGFLYAGLMMTSTGPKLLEFNVRLGDPETQPLMARLSGDIVPALWAAANGHLETAPSLEWNPSPTTCVVLAAHGYPGSVRTGDPISGIHEAERAGALVFHAGTTTDGTTLKTAGGRVLGVTASGATLPDAVRLAYSATQKIRFDGIHFRSDIGRKGLKRWQ